MRHDNAVILQPRFRGNPLEEVWLTGEVCQVNGVYEDQTGHKMTFLVGATFTTCHTDVGVPAQRRLVIFL